MEKISGIYCILNLVNNKRYIGKSNNIYKRWADEKSSLKRKDFHNIHFQRSWDKYGEKSFYFYILERCQEEMLFEKEQFWIQYYDSYKNGYNQTLGGEGTLGVIFSEERKQKIREAHSGVRNFNTREVYCPELDETFWGATEAHDLYHAKYKVNRNGICECCKGKRTYSGKLEDGTKLHWCYLEDKDNFVIPLSDREKPVFCIELNECFANSCEAKKDQRIIKAHNGNILNCCNGHPQHNTCGVLSDGTKLTWRYATTEEVQKLCCIA